jgi:hypothetical protein
MANSDFWAALLASRKTACDELRAMGPVVSIQGVYHQTRRDDVIAALQNSEVSLSVPSAIDGANETTAVISHSVRRRSRSALAACSGVLRRLIRDVTIGGTTIPGQPATSANLPG